MTCVCLATIDHVSVRGLYCTWGYADLSGQCRHLESWRHVGTDHSLGLCLGPWPCSSWGLRCHGSCYPWGLYRYLWSGQPPALEVPKCHRGVCVWAAAQSYVCVRGSATVGVCCDVHGPCHHGSHWNHTVQSRSHSLLVLRWPARYYSWESSPTPQGPVCSCTQERWSYPSP